MKLIECATQSDTAHDGPSESTAPQLGRSMECHSENKTPDSKGNGVDGFVPLKQGGRHYL